MQTNSPSFSLELATQMFQHSETLLLNLPSTTDSLQFPTNLVDPLPKIISMFGPLKHIAQ